MPLQTPPTSASRTWRPAASATPAAALTAPCRCSCGALLARLVSGGVEIRCRRCKQTQIIALEEGRR